MRVLFVRVCTNIRTCPLSLLCVSCLCVSARIYALVLSLFYACLVCACLHEYTHLSSLSFMRVLFVRVCTNIRTCPLCLFCGSCLCVSARIYALVLSVFFAGLV